VVATTAQEDVFLSYHSGDRDLVEQIARRLVVEGRLRPWFDRWSQTAGSAWQEAIGDALDRVGALAVFVGAERLGAWEREEVAVALDRAATDRGFRVFPVLLPGVPDPFDPNELPHFLRTRTWVDLRGGLDAGHAFDDLVRAVKGIPFGPDTLAHDDDICPFRGLRVFEERHAEFFFGRDGDVQRMLERLKESRFLAVLGPSGSGKSSLVRAGLLPALRKPGSTRAPIILRPGAQPLVDLAAALSALSRTAAMRHTLDALADDTRTLHHALVLAHVGHAEDDCAVLCIDQFEEAFALTGDDAGAKAQLAAYIANLVEAGTAPGCPAYVVITVRADFYERLATHHELAQLVSAQQYLVGPLTRDGLREAIEEPARRVGLSLEAGLTDTILADVRDQPGALPLLEHALLEVWRRRLGRTLTLEGYRASGGVEGALTQAAEQVYAGFDGDEQELARRLLLRLTQPGEGAQDTRRRASLRELSPQARHVMGRLADARLLTVSDRDVEIAHETLVRCWPRLREWIEADREGLRVSRRLTAAANEWAASREPDCLYAGSSLALAEDWANDHPSELSDDEQAFLAASRSRERRRTVFRVYANVLLVAALVTVAIAVVALDQRREAVHQRAVAVSGHLAARSIRELESAPERSVLLATQALAEARTDEAEIALRRAVDGNYEMARMIQPRGLVQLAADGSALTRDDRRVVTASDRSGAAIWDVASGRLVRRLGGRGDPVRVAAFAPDGARVLTIAAGGAPRLWDARTGRALRVLGARPAGGGSFSTDGRLVLVVGEGRDVTVWSARTGRLVRRLRDPRPVRSAVFAPSGRKVLSASRDGVARIWDVRSGRVVRRLAAGGSLMGAVFRPDGRAVALWRGDPGVKFVALPSLRTLTLEGGRRAETATFSPDGRFLLTTSGTVASVWDTRSGASTVLRGHDDFLNTAAFSPDGRLVVTTSDDTTSRIWDARSGHELRILRGHTDAVTAAAFTHDGRRVVTASRDGTARTWNADVGVVLRGSRDWILGVALDGAGRLAATGNRTGQVRLWNAATGTTVASMRYPPDRGRAAWWINSVAFGSDRWLVTAAGDDATGKGSAQVWSRRTGKLWRTFPRRDGIWTASAVMSPDGRTLATASDDGARIWDVRRGVVRHRLRGQRDLTDVAYSADGRLLVTASLDGTARVWRAATGAAAAVLRGPPTRLTSAAFSPGGREIVTTGYDRVARIWTVPSGRVVHTLRGHTSAVYGAAFTPDGRQVVTVGNDGTTRIWDTRSGGALAILHLHDESANAVAVAGDRIISGSDDRTARIYRCRTCGPLDRLRAEASAYLARVEGTTSR
jgi:WD40 repeat protein/energy-coupling factor transporter ATP-binding protein EcfA2